tara:strand:+ start:180 stop:656 length:477 start_codon:yes stop_codon:yes gene_type:complete
MPERETIFIPFQPVYKASVSFYNSWSWDRRDAFFKRNLERDGAYYLEEPYKYLVVVETAHGDTYYPFVSIKVSRYTDLKWAHLKINKLRFKVPKNVTKVSLVEVEWRGIVGQTFMGLTSNVYKGKSLAYLRQKRRDVKPTKMVFAAYISESKTKSWNL